VAHDEGVPLQVFVQAQPLCAAHVAIVAKDVHVDAVPEQVLVPAFHAHPACAVHVLMLSRL
jgi:hypothetical protein